MYPWVTHTWNVIKGKCPHDCSYCYMKRFPQGELRFDEKELNQMESVFDEIIDTGIVPEAEIDRDRNIQVPVGLDSVYRLTEAAGYLRAYRGFWENDHTFVIDYQVVDFSERGKIRVTFEGDKMTVVTREEVSGSSNKATARIKD